MCGFTGWFDPQPQKKEVLQRMTAAIQHRGPDASGFSFEGPVAFGHQRLSIIDLAASCQPMSQGRYTLVYNGELYNFRQLREELKGRGHQFRTEGDTEVLLQALIEWGEGALPRLQGMFAFAFWDGETLLLARDHFGIKPLHFSWDGHRLLFASEIKSLLEHPAVSREIDPQAIGLYLECQYIPAPLTIFRQIRKLPAAHFLRLKQGQIEQKRYWLPSYLPKFEGDEEAALAQLGALLSQSVSSMLVSDVPLGAFVSGGIDSSLIAALMQKESKTPIQIFTIGLNHPGSEHEYARRVASHLGASFHPLIVGAKEIIGALDQGLDEPLGDQAALPTLLLSQLTAKRVKVVLTGEGADEVFAGYSNYAKRLKEASLSARYRCPGWFFRLMPEKLRKNRLFKAMSRSAERRYTTIPTLFDWETHKSLLSPDFFSMRGEGLEPHAEEHYFACNSGETLDQMLHIDQALWLEGDLLTKVDRTTMTYSLEARVPYLDLPLVEFAARLPPHFKMRDGTGKYLLKQMARKGWLPPEIVDRPKCGFVIPLREWMSGELKPLLTDALSSGGLLSRNIFCKRAINRLVREESQQRRQHATRLFSLLTLELWFRKFAPNYRA